MISTTKGAEGLEVEEGKQLLIRDELDQIVASVIQLGTDLELQRQLVTAAYRLVQSTYSWPALHRPVTTAVEALFS